jgi:Ca2+-transporting ATPase
MFETISDEQLGISILAGFVSVFWIEIYKVFKRKIEK